MAQGGSFRNRRFGMAAMAAQQAEKPVTEYESFETIKAAGDKVMTLPWNVTFTMNNRRSEFYCHLIDGSKYSQEGVVTPLNPITGESKIPLDSVGKVFFKVKDWAKAVKVTYSDGSVVRKYDQNPIFFGFIAEDGKGYLANGNVVTPDIVEEEAKKAGYIPPKKA